MNRFTTTDDLSLAYSDEGEGLPVICLAGLTRSSTDFDYVAPHLKGVRLIRLDARGRGQSDWSRDYHSYSIPVETRDVQELMDHLGLERAAILGTSRGGMIAMMLSLMAPERILGVCLNDIGPELGPEGLRHIQGYLGRNPAFNTHAEFAAAKPGLMPAFQNVPESRWLEEAQRQAHETPEGLVITYDPTLRNAVLETGAQPGPVMWAMFDAMQGAPLALIRGANSDLLSEETADMMSLRRPDMLRAEVPGRGHIPFLDEPESLEVIQAWLKEMQ